MQIGRMNGRKEGRRAPGENLFPRKILALLQFYVNRRSNQYLL
jgi:hypothetical protein